MRRRSGRQDEHLTRHDRRGRKVVPLTQLPHALPWIARVHPLGDRPERVAGLHAVVALGPARATFTGEQRPEEEHRDDEQRDPQEQWESEHLFG